MGWKTLNTNSFLCFSLINFDINLLLLQEQLLQPYWANTNSWIGNWVFIAKEEPLILLQPWMGAGVWEVQSPPHHHHEMLHKLLIIHGGWRFVYLYRGRSIILTLFHNAHFWRQKLRYLLQVWTDANELVSNDALRFIDARFLNEEGKKQVCSWTLSMGVKTLYVEEKR